MKNEIKKMLTAMQVKDNKQDAEQKAHEIYNMTPDALMILVELGLELSKAQKNENKKNIIRAIILTIFIFYKKNKAEFIDSPYYSQCIDLLIDLSGKGFASALKALSEMGLTEYDMCKKQLLSLPIVEKHLRDKTISVQEAYEEIRLSKNYKGFKGFLKNHYALGNDIKHAHAIYRISQTLFVLRSTRLQ